MDWSTFLLKNFLCIVSLQIGISMLTGMYTMLALVLFIVNGQEFLINIEIGVIVVLALTSIMWLTWIIAFFGAYVSSTGVTKLAIWFWTVYILVWVALSVLTIVANETTYCAGANKRCPPSMWLLDSSSGGKKPGTQTTKKPTTTATKTFRFNENYPGSDEYDSEAEEYDDSAEEEYISITEEYRMKNGDYDLPKRNKKHGGAVVAHRGKESEVSTRGLKFPQENAVAVKKGKNITAIGDDSVRRDVNAWKNDDGTFPITRRASGQITTSRAVMFSKIMADKMKPDHPVNKPKGNSNGSGLNITQVIIMTFFLSLCVVIGMCMGAARGAFAAPENFA